MAASYGAQATPRRRPQNTIEGNVMHTADLAAE